MYLLHYFCRNPKRSSVEPQGSGKPCLRNTGYKVFSEDFTMFEGH